MRERKRQTVFGHRGYKMRSYTELAWARLMDEAGIFYLYEPDLIRLSSRSYLPDFYLPDADMYLEVKGASATDDEREKADQVYMVTGKPVLLLEGLPKSDRGGFMGARVSFRGRHGWVDIPLCDLGELYQKSAGERMYQRLLSVAAADHNSGCRSVGDIAHEVLFNMFDRNGMEEHLREVHAMANQKRLDERGPASRLDLFMAEARKRYCELRGAA